MSIQDYREGNTVWLARLSNGEEVCRYDIDNNSWFDLRDKLYREKLSIVNFSLAFRSHTIHLPSNKDGYMFSLGVLANPIKSRPIMLAGYLEGDQLTISEYIVPELIVWDTFCINKDKCQTLIMNQCMEQAKV